MVRPCPTSRAAGSCHLLSMPAALITPRRPQSRCDGLSQFKKRTQANPLVPAREFNHAEPDSTCQQHESNPCRRASQPGPHCSSASILALWAMTAGRIVAFQLKQILIRILSSFVIGMFTNNQWRWKCVIFAFVISHPIKDVIANSHDKLNRLMFAQRPQLFSAKTISSQISVIFGIQRPNFWG